MSGEYETVVMKEAYGGKGEVRLEMLLGESELKDKCGLFARVTIPKGSSLGYHEHHGNAESYYIVSGEGVYNDNGVERIVKAGETTWTADGSGHGLDNTNGKEDLVFIALIINN